MGDAIRQGGLRRQLGDRNVRKAVEIIAAAARPVPAGPFAVVSPEEQRRQAQRRDRFKKERKALELLSQDAIDALLRLQESGYGDTGFACIERAVIEAAAKT